MELNKDEAVKRFMSEFNSVPLALIEKAYHESWFEEIEFHSANLLDVNDYDNEDEYENDLMTMQDPPMWGMVFIPQFIDEEWITNNIKAVTDVGFMVYESEELGVFLGVNGAGYDFIEAHWEPLYDARVLQWHK